MTKPSRINLNWEEIGILEMPAFFVNTDIKHYFLHQSLEIYLNAFCIFCTMSDEQQKSIFYQQTA